MAKMPTPKQIEAALNKHRKENGRPHIRNAADALGIDEKKLYRIVAKMQIVEEPVAIEQVTADQRTIIGLRDELSRAKKQLVDAHRSSLDDEAIREIIGGLASEPVKPPGWLFDVKTKKGTAQEVPVTIWSDWHAGETVSLDETNGINEFNNEIFERRVRRLVMTTIDLTRNHGPGSYPGVVINLLGDFVSGSLHPELAKTDEERVLPTCLRVRDILVECLETMIEEYGRVYCPCTAGNHGRQTHKPEFKNYVQQNFDWLIYQMLARHFAKDKRITFDIPLSNEVHYGIFGRRFLVMHGDMMGVRGGDGIIGAIGPITRGEMKVGRQSSVVGRDYDRLLIGHWHQQLWLPRVIVNNALKGFDEFAKNCLRAAPSTPAQTLFFEHPKWGMVNQREVYVEDPPAYDKNAPWVGVFGK